MQQILPNLFGPTKAVSHLQSRVTIRNTARLLTQWVLADEVKDQLQVYVLFDYPAEEIHRRLRRGTGILKLNEVSYIPVYSNTTRNDISSFKHSHYRVSYRLPEGADYGIALIQPKL